MTIEIRSREDETAFDVVDPIERRRVSVRFPTPVDLEAADAAAFVYPVDRAVEFHTASLVVEDGASATVLDAEGRTRADVSTDSDAGSVPPGEYYLDVSSVVKVYLHVDAPSGIEFDLDHEASALEIDFGEAVDVRLGARSLHERPEATITTSPAPEDVMTAVSYFGSALKDTSPMRSFPTLRGHPPELEVGDELDVPGGLEKPGTGITVEVPRDYGSVFAVASLAYYLGADVVPGEDRPRLTTDEGFAYPLDAPDPETAVERALKRAFTCDCYVRAAGPYSFDLARRGDFEAATGLDPGPLFERTPATRIERYLSVPHEAVEPFVPEWSAGAHLEPMIESIEYLPFLARDLAVVRSPAVRETVERASAAPGPSTAAASGTFARNAATDDPIDAFGPPDPADPREPVSPPGDHGSPATETDDGGTATAGSTGSSGVVRWPGMPEPVVRPEPLDATEQLWIADGVPIGASEPTLGAYRNGLDRSPVEREIEAVVVCNDSRMAAENESVGELLGDNTPFDLQVRPYRDLYADELRAVLERDADFFHFVGHVDEEGFVCADGHLDASTLGTVGVDAFFLNACDSYEQGRTLLDAGAIAGIVTTVDVLNDAAVGMGQLVSRLLDNGFPLGTALRVATGEHGIEEGYTVVGDAGMQVTQAEGKTAFFTRVEALEDGGYRYRAETFPTDQSELGSVVVPYSSGVRNWYLAGDTAEARIAEAELRESLALGDRPVWFDGDLRWSSELLESSAHD